MIRTQRWIPDTCADRNSGDCCSVLETWDDADPELTRTHSYAVIERRCSLHAPIADGAALYALLYLQNRRKNTCWRMANAINTAITSDKWSALSWSFDANDVLTVNIGTLLNSQQKNNLQNQCDVQFGPGKVVIV